MKQGALIQAYKALQKLAGQELPIKIACAIHRQIVAIRPAWEFQIEEERKIIGRLGPDVQPNGDLQFKSTEDAVEFKSRMGEIADMDVDDVRIDTIILPDSLDAFLTARDIEALDGFVNFSEV
jgi:hypothetical protein